MRYASTTDESTEIMNKFYINICDTYFYTKVEVSITKITQKYLPLKLKSY